jgi:hypothetical protein
MDSIAASTLPQLLQEVHAWLRGPQAYPPPPAVVEDIAVAVQELTVESQQSEDAVAEPLLLVLLLGGSGTGKSTLFNALAGERLASVQVRRPTTTAPIAYVHADIPVQRLTAYPPLQHIQVQRHRRAGLHGKILVDTPDFDTHQAVLDHRHIVLDLLPFCDLILFVVSPEKYVDRAAWDVLLPQVPHRAFAFVFTKVDLLYDDGGTPPYADLLAMVQAAGYAQPRLYRVAAEHWLQYRTGERQNPPVGDDFLALESWLEDELRREDVAELKAHLRWRKLEYLHQALLAARPPALEQVLPSLRQAWEVCLGETANTLQDMVHETVQGALSRLQMEVVIEQHRQFRGLLGGYFALVDLLRFAPTLLLQHLRQEPGGQSYVIARLRDALAGPLAREAWQRLHVRLRHAAGELTMHTDGTGPLRWLSTRLSPLEPDGPLWLSQALPALFAQLLTPPVARNPLMRGAQYLCKCLFEFLPLLFVGICGYQLTVSFLQGQYLGAPFLLHTGALLLLLCLGLHGGVALVFPLAWVRRHRRFTHLLAEQVQRLLLQRYMGVLDDFAAAVRQEQQQLDQFCEQLQAQQRLLTLSEPTSVQGVFAMPETWREP